jgi:adenosylhomocysteine nucleosidase
VRSASSGRAGDRRSMLSAMAVDCVAVLAAMRLEIKPLVQAYNLQREEVNGAALYRGKAGITEVVATTMSLGTAAAAAATERILDAANVDHLICIGVAGGLGPSVKVRDLIVPEVVIDGATRTEYRPAPLPGFTPRGKMWTSDDFETDPIVLQPLADEGVVALDMETAAIAQVCERRGVPWSVARGLSDHVVDAPVEHAVMGLARPDGSANVGALVRYVLPKPWRLKYLAGLAKNSTAAANASVDAVRQALPAL